jgi:hypothetical protein
MVTSREAARRPLFLAESSAMNPAQSPAAHTPVNVSAAEQARTIRKAQANGRAILAWTATLADGRAVVLLAATERSARSLAPHALRVAPAAVRDVAGLVSRALAAAPPPRVPTPSPTAPPPAPKQPARDPVFERQWRELLEEEAREQAARAERVYWATGEGPRPVLPVVRREYVAGEPRHQITARPRPGVGAPFVGEASLVGTGRGARVSHEYVPERVAAPAWAPAASPAPVVSGRRRAPADPIFWS